MHEANSRRASAEFPTGDSDASRLRDPASESPEEDRRWVEEARLGDPRAFERLVEKYQDRAIAVARRFVRDEELARDVAQEGFVRLYRSLHRYDPEHRFYTWFYRIVVHLAIDATRRRTRVRDLLEARAREPSPTVPDPACSLEQAELRERVAVTLEQVPLKYRMLLVLRDLEGFSSKEISEISGSNHATVRWRLHRAREIFRGHWERGEGGSARDANPTEGTGAPGKERER